MSAFLTIAGVLLFPRPLFAHKLHYKEFTVCSGTRVDPVIKQVLEGAKMLTQHSELYDPDYHFNIILAYHTFYNKIDDKFMGFGPAARARLNNVILKIKIDPQQNLAYPTFPTECQTNLAELIAHEMLHCLQAEKYGLKKFNPYNHPPFWKLEGYPEYISKQSKWSAINYNLVSEIERYIALTDKSNSIWIVEEEKGCEAPHYYFKGRLMTEYLMNVRRWTYDRILKDTASEDAVFSEMIKWKDSVTIH